MHMNAKCERFKLKFIVKNQRSARKYAMLKGKQTAAHTHTHMARGTRDLLLPSLAHKCPWIALAGSTQEASIIQNIRNFERLSTIAPSSANHAQFVKIISSYFFCIFFLLSLHFIPHTLWECVGKGCVSWGNGKKALCKLGNFQGDEVTQILSIWADRRNGITKLCRKLKDYIYNCTNTASWPALCYICNISAYTTIYHKCKVSRLYTILYSNCKHQEIKNRKRFKQLHSDSFHQRKNYYKVNLSLIKKYSSQFTNSLLCLS